MEPMIRREGRRPFAPRFATNFAPVSSGPSTRLAIVTFLFFANAVWLSFLLVVVISNLVFRFFTPLPSIWISAVNIVLLAAVAAFCWFVGRDLRAQRRRASLFAVPYMALSALQTIFHRPHDPVGIVIAVGLLVALVSVKDELTKLNA